MIRGLVYAALCLLPLWAQASVNLATAPISRMDLPWWRARFEMSLQQAQQDPNAQILWLGDSITQYWQRSGGHTYDDILPVWNEYYAPYHALDFGMIGDTTANLIWRLNHGQIAHLHPRIIIILIGANNLGHVHWGAPQSIPGIEAVVANAHNKIPNAHIILLGILPSIRSTWVDTQTRTINAALAAHYQHSDFVEFADLGSLFIKNRKVDGTLFVDPHLRPPEPALHPNAEGMRRIAIRLAPLIKADMQ